MPAILPRVTRLGRGLVKHGTTLRRKDVLLLAQIIYLFGKVLLLQGRRALPDLVAAFDAAPSEDGRQLRTSPARLVWLVDGVMRATLGKDYCMKRSLLLFHFLRRWGYDVRIHFGVKKQDQELKGHAWVDFHGQPFAEPLDPRVQYVRTFSFPALPETSPAKRTA